MPTPMSFYYKAAELWGGVDPNDREAVHKFFIETVPRLPKKKREDIMRFLFTGEFHRDKSPDQVAKALVKRKRIAQPRKPR